MCRKAQAFGMRVLAWDPYLSEEQFKSIGAESASFERMLGEGHSIVRYYAPREVHLGRSHVLCEAELAAVDMLNAYLAQTMR